jgi:hypothetical protein
MSQVSRWLLTISFLLVVACRSEAEDDDAARALVVKAIHALGAETRIAKLKAFKLTFKANVYARGGKFTVAGESAIQGTDQIRTVINEPASSYKVLNRDKGWVKIGDMLMDMAVNEVKAAQDDVHEQWVRTLVPLEDKAYTLSSLGESKVDDVPALGIRVSCEGHKDVSLYFAKGTFLLLKSEMKIKDDETGKEVNREFINSDFKEIGSRKEPTRFVIKKDGKLFMEVDVKDITRVEKLDDSIFAKP